MDYVLSLRRPAAVRRSIEQLQKLVDEIQPDLVHCHTVTAVMLARLALRKYAQLPRAIPAAGALPSGVQGFAHRGIGAFQAQRLLDRDQPGNCELLSDAGVKPERLFLSYPGTTNIEFNEPRTGWLRDKLALASSDFIVGNVNHIYLPVWYLNQRIGLKCHEDLIDGIFLRRKRIVPSEAF